MADWLKKVVVPTLLLAFAGSALWVRFHASARATVSDFLAPFFRVERRLAWRASREPLFLKSKTELIRTIEDQQLAVDELRRRLGREEALERENGELRRRLNLAPAAGFSAVAARIVTWDPAVGYRRLRLDRGESDGIAVGQAVLAGDALLGRVREVSRRAALVLCLTDPGCRVAVRIPGTEAIGVLHGEVRQGWRASPRCLLDYLPRDITYAASMPVETSSFSRFMPAGIPVGALASDSDGELTRTVDGLYCRVHVRPHTVGHSFSFVLVLVPAAPLSASSSESGADP